MSGRATGEFSTPKTSFTAYHPTGEKSGVTVKYAGQEDKEGRIFRAEPSPFDISTLSPAPSRPRQEMSINSPRGEVDQAPADADDWTSDDERFVTDFAKQIEARKSERQQQLDLQVEEPDQGHSSGADSSGYASN